jgi:hypothetical protein
MLHILPLLGYRLLGLLVLSCFVVAGCLQREDNQNHRTTGPEEVVATYCKADFEGATLSTKNYNKSGIAALLWKVEETGPAWDYAILIEGFRITSVAKKGDQSEVTVEYAVIGEWAVDVKIKRHTEHHVFQVKQVQASWKLLDPVDLPPHISIPTAIRHIEMLMRIQEEPEGPATIKKLKTLDKSANKTIQPTAYNVG